MNTANESTLPSLRYRLVALSSGIPATMCFTIIVPILPKMEAALAHGPDDAFLVKMTVAINGLAMVIGAPLAGYLTDRMGRVPVLAGASPMIAALVLAFPLLALGRLVFEVQSDLQLDLARQAAWQQSIDRIATAPGPVACETLALCYWAGRPSAIDFFNFGQYASLHPAFGDAIAEQLRNGRLALIQEDGHSGSRRLSPALNAAVSARYEPLQTAPTTLLAPAPR